MSDLVFGILLAFYIIRITHQATPKRGKSNASERSKPREARIVPE